MRSTLVPMRNRLPSLFSRFEREMEDLMGRFWGQDESFWEGDVAFYPELNVAETDKDYEVSMDLPGIKPEDLTVEVRNGVLSIRGERKVEKEEKGRTYHRMERQYGKFHRSIPLELPVDEGKVEAKFHEGVLRITVPKSPEAETKRITIKT